MERKGNYGAWYTYLERTEENLDIVATDTGVEEGDDNQRNEHNKGSERRQQRSHIRQEQTQQRENGLSHEEKNEYANGDLNMREEASDDLEDDSSNHQKENREEKNKEENDRAGTDEGKKGTKENREERTDDEKEEQVPNPENESMEEMHMKWKRKCPENKAKFVVISTGTQVAGAGQEQGKHACNGKGNARRVRQSLWSSRQTL